MQSRHETLQVLRSELVFLSQGGYRSPLGWRCPLIFEDSPTCVKGSLPLCPRRKCVLMNFVPRKRRHELAPCRHIPLNELGETLDSLYRTGTNEEIEQCLRHWIRMTITQLEESSTGACSEDAAA